MALITIVTTNYPNTFSVSLNDFALGSGFETTEVFFEEIAGIDLTHQNKAVVSQRKHRESLYITCYNDASFQGAIPVYPIIGSIDGTTFSNNQALRDFILTKIRL